MLLSEILAPNLNSYTAPSNGRYLSTRLVTHNGVTIAVALRKTFDGSLFFDYSILNADDNQAAQEQASTTAKTTDKLDSQCWFENVKALQFPSEVRVVGEEAVPVYEIPALDRSRRKVVRAATQPERLNKWLSSSLCLMNPNVTDFQVLSDGRYVYLFRQGASAAAASPNPYMTENDGGAPPVDGNLLCDRFILVGTTLSQPLEARYQRSRQKQIPLNEQDTLRVKDINDASFYEPTHSLRFVRDLAGGRFSVLRAPTVVNDVTKWMIFAYSDRSGQIECLTTDVAPNGLFDLHGHVYYTCDSEKHATKVFASGPGACTASRTDNGQTCNKARVPIVPKTPASKRALQFSDEVELRLREEGIYLSGLSDGFTLEAWVNPESSPSEGSFFCLFSQASGASPGVFLDDKLRLVLRVAQKNETLLTSRTALKTGKWSHVAVTYTTASSTYTFVINGIAACTVSCSAKPGVFSGIGLLAKDSKDSFRGLLDEVRLWSYPLQPSTVKARMSSRATGLEPDLESCWHFDEESGTTIFDATSNNHELRVVTRGGGSIPSDTWAPISAPVVASYGLTRRVLRLPSVVEIRGGLHATIYNEQVAISETKTEVEEKPKAEKKSEMENKPKTEEGSDSQKASSSEAEAKYMKRGTRVLLCFVTRTRYNCLAALDFALLSDGTLPDTPASIPLPRLQIPPSASRHDKPGQAGPRVSTALLYVGSQGMEIFGGALDFQGADCGIEAPYVFESAVGTVSIFFRRSAGSFSALTYHISRRVDAVALPTSRLGGQEGLLAASKLRKAKNVVFETELCPWAPAHLAVNLTLTANMDDDKKIVEKWTGIPSQLDKLCSLLNGTYSASPGNVGTVAEMNELSPNSYPKQKPPPTKLLLEQGLATHIAAGTHLGIGERSYAVLEDAKTGDKALVVSLYNDRKPKGDPPGKGFKITSKGYDHAALVTCEGKPAGDVSHGSSLVGVTWPPSAITTDQYSTEPDKQMQAPWRAFITSSGMSPAIGSPPVSTALRLDGSTIYSMLENVVATPACSGICFESWIKTERATSDTILVAYTSERSPRADGLPTEEQTFVLGVPEPSSNSDKYDIVGNINGQRFFVNQHKDLKLGQWAHVTCSARNAFALQFSGNEYVDLGTAAEWNLSDFSLVFTLQLSNNSSGEQSLLVKADPTTGITPIDVKVTSDCRLLLSYWASNEDGSKPTERKFYSPKEKPLVRGEPYKVFLSRKLVRANKANAAPKPYQVVAMRAWNLDGSLHMELDPGDISKLEKSGVGINYEACQAHDIAQGNEGCLSLGGTEWSGVRRLQGVMGSVQLYSSAMIPAPSSVQDLGAITGNMNAKGMLASWSCREPGGLNLIDDLGRNHGKLKGDLGWVLSPYKTDHQLSVFVNATLANFEQPKGSSRELLALATPAGPHQLSLGNVMVAALNDEARFLGLARQFRGELDELRIWNVPRTKENICDSLNTRLTETSADLAVYLPFNALNDGRTRETAAQVDNAILTDLSVNCWHLTPLFGAATVKVNSQAPIGLDSPCVDHTLNATLGPTFGVTTPAGPSVAEYGDVEISASGAMEGSYKRVYSYIENSGKWCLVTGFRIGALKTEWVGQVQTSPTLIGFIEGAPPLPVDTFIEPSTLPATSVTFRRKTRCTYTYSSRSEEITDKDRSLAGGGGLQWDVNAGAVIQTQVWAGHVKGSVKRAVNISEGKVNNEVRASTTNVNMEMGVQLTGFWKEDSDDGKKSEKKSYQASNTGLALVESEVADMFALRLQMRGRVAPVVAYQMRPNPDIPKDRNLVSFKINPAYTKQGCLDGRRGLKNDPDYSPMSLAPKDASYYKPAEAYALRERIRRAEEQRQGEYDRRVPLERKPLPQRTHRNICNSYVWTADGGTFQETNSTLDMVQAEIGGNTNSTKIWDKSLDFETANAGILVTAQVDLMDSVHTNFIMTKEKSSDEGFELETKLPPSVDIRHKDPVTGNYVKRPGAVDAYRWMSFWLEPSVESTDTFFKQVLDPVWLDESPEPDAQLLRSLQQALAKETGNARTKAWRVLHRCTYVSRVPEHAEQRPTALAAPKEEKKSTMLADVACNWLLLQKLEPFARDAKTRAELPAVLKPHVLTMFPSLLAQPRLYAQVLNMVAEYFGLS